MSALLLGAVTTGMLLGHWYLIDSGLTLGPFWSILRFFVTMLVVQAVLMVVDAALRYLRNHGSDMVLSNQMHIHWRRAFEVCGFFQGPSNFVLAVSPRLAELLEPYQTSVERIHMTRGDGDGPAGL